MDAPYTGDHPADRPTRPASPSVPFGIVGRKVRAIFAATTQQPAPQPPQKPETPPPAVPEAAVPESKAPAPAPDAPAPAAPEPAPAAPAPSDGTPLVIIRNCSTRQVLETLLAELGGAADVSGRYFAPAVQDPERIRSVAASHDLFTKESRIRGVVILDLMVDRTIHPIPAPGRNGPWRRRFERDNA